jgi:aspartokinase
MGNSGEQIKALVPAERIISELKNLSSITIRLPKSNVYSPGLYYFFLKALAWEGINVIEVVSTYTELTIVLENKDVDRAFSVLKRSFT